MFESLASCFAFRCSASLIMTTSRAGCHSERSEESLIISSVFHGPSKIFGCCPQSSLRSSHRGFVCSIRAIFLLRRQPFWLFLTSDRVIHIAKVFDPNEPVQMITLSESFQFSVPML